jgi:hypothetical protein
MLLSGIVPFLSEELLQLVGLLLEGLELGQMLQRLCRAPYKVFGLPIEETSLTLPCAFAACAADRCCKSSQADQGRIRASHSSLTDDVF